MKRLLILGCLALNVALLSCGPKKKEANAVPEAVMTSFSAKYPTVTDVKWETERSDGKDLFDGEFKADGKKVTAQFDDQGNFIKEKP